MPDAVPAETWAELSGTLNHLLPGLIGVSRRSVGRYRNGERPTPGHVAARLRAVAAIVADLAGSYNDSGIRRWFGRSRPELNGKAPADIMIGDWDPISEQVQQILQLAAWLTGRRAAE